MCASRARREGEKIVPQNMSLESFKVIASKLNFPAHFTFGNKSEPMANPELFNMIKHLRAVNKNAYTQILTNFTLLDNFGADAVIDSGLDHILVGLDGIDGEMYSKYRVGGDFQAVINNIKSMQKSPVKMEIVFVVFKHNEHVLEKAKKMAKDLGCDITFRRTDSHPGFEDWLPQNIDFCKTEIFFKPPVESVCGEPWVKMNIYHDGEVSTCCSEAQVSAGNILKQSFDEIWNGEAYKTARQTLLGGASNASCLDCAVYKKDGLNAFNFKV